MHPRVPARQASVLLEELGVPYELHAISLSKNEQKEDWFLKINPNGRIPAMTDGDVRVFESGALVACRGLANLAGGFRDPMELRLLLPPLGC
jgi:glutathione S-transferase